MQDFIDDISNRYTLITKSRVQLPTKVNTEPYHEFLAMIFCQEINAALSICSVASSLKIKIGQYSCYCCC